MHLWRSGAQGRFPLGVRFPEDARDLAALDPKAIQEASDNAWPRIRDAYELHDALLSLGVLPEEIALSRDGGSQPADMEEWFAELVQTGRAFRLSHGNDRTSWLAAENIPLALAAYPDAAVEPEPPDGLRPPLEVSEDDAILTIVRGWAECSGPFTCAEMSQNLGIPEGDVNIALARLEGKGLVLRGRYRPEVEEEEFCDRRILARIHRATIDGSGSR